MKIKIEKEFKNDDEESTLITRACASVCGGIIWLLGILFLILKLTNVINWSWWWVLSPIWIPMTLAVLLLIILLIIYFCVEDKK